MPLQIIRDVKLQRPNLAMIAWTSLKVGPSLREVYVPLEITRASHANTSIEELPQITIVPGRPLDEVYVTVELLGDDLRTVRTLVTKQKVRDIKYPAKLPRPFSFPANIPRPIFLPPIGVTGPGFYSITLSADETDGPPVTNDPVILYYARP
ncbi:MAG: hypothetical protein LAO55_28515 [Acidobacteriia bacterium]|nr:hypothetical protein [Terriglobia bacterium]